MVVWLLINIEVDGISHCLRGAVLLGTVNCNCLDTGNQNPLSKTEIARAESIPFQTVQIRAPALTWRNCLKEWKKPKFPDNWFKKKEINLCQMLI